MSSVMDDGQERQPAASERFVIQRQLGAGAMGVVYEAYDSHRKSLVALKTLRHLDAAGLYRFKKEFRALADLSHPNLVSLYELVSVEGEWFFTMELLQAVDFLSYVRPREDESPAEMADGPSTSSLGPAPGRRVLTQPNLPLPGQVSQVVDVPRLRSALAQLAGGVHALHQAGRLHRDLKPSNVLVTQEDRVVICDFGLVTEVEGDHATPTQDDHAVGTAAYMSPEQAACLPLGPASDWYAVGAILYQALTGRLPFSGHPQDILVEKQMREPPSPGALVPDVPRDLDELVTDLLRRHPARRPSGNEMMVRLGLARPPTEIPVTGSLAVPFVGREQALAELEAAFRVARAGHAAVVLVEGASGVGKTTLVRRFLEGIAARGEANVLAGRCYENELVPYKALDSLIDAMAAHLVRLPRDETQALLPEGIGALGRLFPVLRRVDGVPEPPIRALDSPDAQELRARAFVALRELAARLARRRPLVLAIDDAQWGDPDSAALLGALLRPPAPPPLLLLCCYRSEEAHASPLVDALRRLRGVDLRTLRVEALAHDAARTLAAVLLEREDATARALAETIATESGGSPFFVYELVRHMRADAAHPRTAPLALDDVLRERLERLPAKARLCMRLLAVAGRPMGREWLRRAADLGSETAVLQLLRVERMVRSHGAGGRDEIEIFHDRIREATLGALSAEELRDSHRSLAIALQALGDADPRALHEHFRAAGDAERASHFAQIAAAQAMEALAFDRAAQLYRAALEIHPQDARATSRLRTLEGDALGSAGRGMEAAQAYLSALDGASAAEALELRRRAADQLLRNGHFEQGLAAISDVLAAVGLRLARTPTRALASLLLRRLLIRLRGTRFQQRDTSQISAEMLERVDICWSVASTLSLIDTVRGNDFQGRHLLLALEAGEPYRIARGLAMESAYASIGGGRSRRRTDRLLAATRSLSERLQHPHAVAMAELVGGVAAFLRGEWRMAHGKCEHAEGMLRDRCRGVTWEIDSAQFFGLGSLMYLGELAELRRRVPQALDEALERGDLYAATGLRSWRTNMAWLAADDPDEAAQQVEKAQHQWSKDGFHLQHYYEVFALVQVDLYRGDGAAAQERLEQRWRALGRSLLLRIQNIRIEAAYLRARCALAQGNPALLRVAERSARALEREQMAWSAALAKLVRASIAARKGDLARAAMLLRAAAGEFDGAEMALHAAAARQLLGQLLGGDEGRALTEGVARWMTSQSIRNPERMIAMLTCQMRPR